MNKQQITTKQLALCSVLLTLVLVTGLGREPVSTAAGRTGHQAGFKQRRADFRGLHAVPADGVGTDAAESGAVLAVFGRRGCAAVRTGRRRAVAGKHVSPSRMKWMHPVTVSIVGGVMHNVGQIVMAMIILHTSQLAYYMAVLMLSGILFGALTGVSATLVMKHMKHIKWGK